MKRKNFPFLAHWLASKDRKPPVIRGARQVDRTWLVRPPRRSLVKVQVKNPTQNEIGYTLLSLPFYLLEQVHRLIKLN